MHEISFAEVPAGLGSVLAARGFTELTPIQTAVLSPEFAGRDLRISSQTGSGKTVALGLVVADEVAEAVTLSKKGPGPARPSVLLVAPTRELAVQLAEELTWLFKPLGATVVSLTCEASPLATHSHVVIGLDNKENTDDYLPMTSRIVQLVVLDVLAIGVMLQRGEGFLPHLARIKASVKNTRLPDDSD